jgi:hypothetical protein
LAAGAWLVEFQHIRAVEGAARRLLAAGRCCPGRPDARPERRRQTARRRREGACRWPRSTGQGRESLVTAGLAPYRHGRHHCGWAFDLDAARRAPAGEGARLVAPGQAAATSAAIERRRMGYALLLPDLPRWAAPFQAARRPGRVDPRSTVPGAPRAETEMGGTGRRRRSGCASRRSGRASQRA